MNENISQIVRYDNLLKSFLRCCWWPLSIAQSNINSFGWNDLLSMKLCHFYFGLKIESEWPRPKQLMKYFGWLEGCSKQQQENHRSINFSSIITYFRLRRIGTKSIKINHFSIQQKLVGFIDHNENSTDNIRAVQITPAKCRYECSRRLPPERFSSIFLIF